MKRIVLLLLFLLLPHCVIAESEYDFMEFCHAKYTSNSTLYSIVYETADDGSKVPVDAVPIATLPAGTYYKPLSPGTITIAPDDKYFEIAACLNGRRVEGYHRVGESSALLADVTVWLVNYSGGSDAAIGVNEVIARTPEYLERFMNKRYPSQPYSLIPPYLREETVPAPESPTDKPASTEKTSTSTSTTKKPTTTKKAKATATPAPTEVPAPEAWLSADWLADNVDADCTERREVGIVRLGVVDSDVTLDGVDYTVPTDALTFAEGVKDKHRIAAIYAPRTGRCILRAKASEKAKELDKCPAGTIVPVLEYGKTWTKIRYDGQVGYVKTSVLTFLGDKGEPIGTGVTSYQGKATGNAQVPVRNGKTSEAEIIVNLRTATEVTVLSFDGKWYEIDHDGWYGFLYKSYFMFDDE